MLFMCRSTTDAIAATIGKEAWSATEICAGGDNEVWRENNVRFCRFGMETFADLRMGFEWNQERFSILKWSYPGHRVVQDWAPTSAWLVWPKAFRGNSKFYLGQHPHYLSCVSASSTRWVNFGLNIKSAHFHMIFTPNLRISWINQHKQT